MNQWSGAPVTINKPHGGTGAATVRFPTAAFSQRLRYERREFNVAGTFISTHNTNAAGTAFRYRFRGHFTISGRTAEEHVVRRDQASVDAWGVREITYPPWFRAGAIDGIDDRLAQLARPRQFINVTLPLWQRDAGRAVVLRTWEPGDYATVNLHDPATSTDIVTLCLVMSVRYRYRAGHIPEKTLRMIETGHSAERNRIMLESNPVFLENSPVYLR